MIRSSKTHVTLEAVNTGFEPTVRWRPAFARWMQLGSYKSSCRQRWMHVHTQSTRFPPDRIDEWKFEFVEIVTGRMIESLPPVSDRACSAATNLSVTLCNSTLHHRRRK